jgi:ATP adenylyltransferase
MKTLWAPWRMEYILKAQEGNSEACIFCSRISRDEDKNNLILWRSKKSFIIMNRFPYNNGHLMIVPYRHSGNFLDLEPEENVDLSGLIQFSIKAIDRLMKPQGYNIGMNLGRVAGAGVEDHVHYHLVPRWNGDTNYMPVISGTKVISESLNATYDKLLNSFKDLARESQ